LCCNELRITLTRVVDESAGGEHGRALTDRIGLGVVTRLVHRDLVDEVLADTGRTQRRLLPARVVVYFVLAMTLFFDDAHEEVIFRWAAGSSQVSVPGSADPRDCSNTVANKPSPPRVRPHRGKSFSGNRFRVAASNSPSV
jgi:Insertion element 4 transposase N-terminal